MSESDEPVLISKNIFRNLRVSNSKSVDIVTHDSLNPEYNRSWKESRVGLVSTWIGDLGTPGAVKLT